MSLSSETEEEVVDQTTSQSQESQAPVDLLALSDDEILNMTEPPAVVASEAPAQEQVQSEEKAEAEPEEPAQAADPSSPGSGEADKAAASEPVEKPEAQAESGAPDYEAFYKQIMTPFKANGKMIELKDPSEAIQLMQMGANFTRKMQELAPHRKALTMLQAHSIDETKLSFLIDLDKKDPEAIKKLIKESGIDPMEIDTSSEPAYLEGNHRVTDEEVNFRSTVDDLRSTPTGIETLQVINNTWDQASKDLLWKHPETMAIIHEQRETGVYDRISAEVDRQRVLGVIPVTVPFLQAYEQVGKQLVAANAFADLQAQHGAQATAPASTPVQPLATRVVAPKPQVKNSDAARAASPTRAAATPAQPLVNPLAMSDDEFLQKFSGRL